MADSRRSAVASIGGSAATSRGGNPTPPNQPLLQTPHTLAVDLRGLRWNAEWNVCHIPMAVLEWKVFRARTRPPRMSAYDLDWLERFSRGRRDFIGCAVSLDLAARSWRLRAARVYDGHTDMDWLTL